MKEENVYRSEGCETLRLRAGEGRGGEEGRVTRQGMQGRGGEGRRGRKEGEMR